MADNKTKITTQDKTAFNPTELKSLFRAPFKKRATLAFQPNAAPLKNPMELSPS